ncbi:helix-hairpin-helix domain-containing protein [Kocuria kalidii]|uniref:helix-hairpin-helix domain-containing protein n=1 Tax=Kocuria kalidii TaxID=3376283 RepID=UPI0037BE1214
MTGTVPRARRRATPTPPEPATGPTTPAAPGTGSASGTTGCTAPAERLAALLAEAGTAPAAPGTDPPAGHRSGGAPSGTVPAHRWEVATRTRVPPSLLLIALLALAGLAWTVLGPGAAGPDPDAAALPAIAEADLDPGTAAGAPNGAPSGAGAPPPGTSARPSPGPTLYVHVTGEVARPGVVPLEAGARVVDAVEAAGGLTDGAVTETVNLAAPVTDGQQVLVPDADAAPAPGLPPAPGAPAATGEQGGAPAAAGVQGAAPAGLLDLNTATAADLETLPRVGPVLAGRIVAFRGEHGGFAAVADLDAVPGIGPALMEALTPLVTV